MKDLLFLSNGHGEDEIACRVIDALREEAPDASVEAWPMVGAGLAYGRRGVALVGEANDLPSAGFATLSPRLMLTDLGAGWIGTHWRQYRAARGLRGRYRLAVAVGDIVPMLGAVVSRSRFAFVGCAKSSYYRGRFFRYTGLEKALLRRHCERVFPRDRLTADELAEEGIPAIWRGNPMMDGLEGSGDRLGTEAVDTVVAMLAGSRDDAEANMLDLLAMVTRTHLHLRGAGRLRFVFAARPQLSVADFMRRLAKDERLAPWDIVESAHETQEEGLVLRLRGPDGMEALVAKGRFADILRMASLAVGMAGTANEQAIGLGVPLIAVPSAGVQGARFVRMKAEYFGEAVLTVAREPEAVSRAVAVLLSDPGRREEMAAAGRERMGEPGGARAIAADIAGMLAR